MNKKNILAIAVKRAMRVTESVGIGIAPLLAAAVIAMITSSAASARQHAGDPPPLGWSRAWRVPRAAPSAPMVRCTSPKAQPAGSRASIRRPGRSRRSPAVCRQRSPRRSASVGRSTSRSSTTTAYALVTLVGPDVGGSDVDGIYRVDGPDSFHRRRGHRRSSTWPIRRPSPFDRPDRSPVRAANLPWRLPGHRWAPQPRAAGHTRRRDHRVDRLRQHRPDRAGGVGQHGVHGRGRPRPPPARRTARLCRSGRNRPPPRR